MFLENKEEVMKKKKEKETKKKSRKRGKLNEIIDYAHKMNH